MHKCTECKAEMEFGETLRNGQVKEWQYHDCDFCKSRMSMKAVSDIDPMLFRRCGWGDKPSTWEEINWRPR